MICPNCETANETGRKFCGGCASPLATACPACGTLNQPGMRFCGECATALVTGSSPVVVAAARTAAVRAEAVREPVAERRLVSILFADLVGFTALSADRDPEETRDLLTRYFELCREVIARYGGSVEKFIGDAVMAVWGAPSAHEDDAERAVRAGLDLVDAVRTLGPSIQARAGVLTGEAAVTLGATHQGMVAGDLVNTASRLQSVAAPGTVLVGEATQRAASKAIAFEEVGDQVLKGKTAPVPAWRALRVVAERGGRNRSDSLEAPFVGRDDELRLLKDLFHATSREGRSRLVSVIGPAGIGKTRLAWEFLKYLDGLVENVWFHDGRSPAYGEGISFWALGEMVRRRAGLRETDDEPTTRARLTATLAEHVPDPDERRWIEPALLALLGIESGIGSEQLFGAWRTFFERLAATAPVVMVFEDFHFADSGLLDFVDHLMEWSKSVPIYVVTLSRPELLEKRETWGAGKRNFVSVYLEPLTEPAVRALLTGLVPGLPDATVRAIVARADGIPLYAVETVRMLLAEGRLRLEGDIYVPVGDLTTLAVPETLTALIASRLDGLAPGDRGLVQDSAVLGQSFTLGALAAISGVPQDELEPRLRALVRRELLTLEADPRSPERGQYAFVQALIREVAYNTLARADRKVRHLAAARFFEGLGSDELAGALAGQYLAAHRNAPDGPEADALAGQARRALRAAAERAAALGAHDQAGSFLDQALTVSTDPADRADLLVLAARSAGVMARGEDAERYLQAAIAQFESIGDRDGALKATAALVDNLLMLARAGEVIPLLETRLRDLSDDESAPTVALMIGLARAYAMHDEPHRALEMVERALPLAERQDQVEDIASGLMTRSGAIGRLGRNREATALIRGALDLVAGGGLTNLEMRARILLTFLNVRDDPRVGLADARAGLEIARRLGSRRYALSMVGNGVDCAFRTGDWGWALATLREFIDDDLTAGDAIELRSDLARFLACRGEDSAELLAGIEPLLGRVSDPQYDAYRSMAHAWRALARGDLQGAVDAARRAADGSLIFGDVGNPLAFRGALWLHDADAARRTHDTHERSRGHGSAVDVDRVAMQAGLLALDGHRPEALARYREAIRRWRDLGLVWDEALCGIDMLTVLDAADPEVRAAAERSREILVRLGATPFVARLDDALARGEARPATRRPASEDRALV